MTSPASDTRDATDRAVLALIRSSLAVWGISASVSVESDGRWIMTLDDGSAIIVARAPHGIPFRWMLTTASGRERPSSSVPGLLRVLRSTLDPGWRPGRARIVSRPLPNPSVT